jgi:hypothetical protein
MGAPARKHSEQPQRHVHRRASSRRCVFGPGDGAPPSPPPPRCALHRVDNGRPPSQLLSGGSFDQPPCPLHLVPNHLAPNSRRTRIVDANAFLLQGPRTCTPRSAMAARERVPARVATTPWERAASPLHAGCASIHATTSKCLQAAAKLRQACLSHGQPFCRAHCSAARWPPIAAVLHVCSSQGQPCCRAH